MYCNGFFDSNASWNYGENQFGGGGVCFAQERFWLLVRQPLTLAVEPVAQHAPCSGDPAMVAGCGVRHWALLAGSFLESSCVLQWWQENPRAIAGGGAAGEGVGRTTPESWRGPKVSKEKHWCCRQGAGMWITPQQGWGRLGHNVGKMLRQTMDIHGGVNCGRGGFWIPLLFSA